MPTLIADMSLFLILIAARHKPAPQFPRKTPCPHRPFAAIEIPEDNNDLLDISRE